MMKNLKIFEEKTEESEVEEEPLVLNRRKEEE